MIRMIQTNNESNGFFGTISLARGQAAAEAEWRKAFDSVAAVYGMDPTILRNYLDSVFGRHAADAVLAGISMEAQLADLKRAGMFERHIEKIAQQTIDGWFE